MNETYSTALTLLAVGMTTVFTILALIVIFGNLLTTLVNKYFPETPTGQKLRTATEAIIRPGKMAAIISAVDIATKGRAKVTSIKKADRNKMR